MTYHLIRYTCTDIELVAVVHDLAMALAWVLVRRPREFRQFQLALPEEA